MSMQTWGWVVSTVFFCITIAGVDGLRLTSVIIPSHVHRGHQVTMACVYDLQGRDLYSIKWYKDGREFYRFEPSVAGQKRAFRDSGLLVDTEVSNATHVTLSGASLAYAGRYICEVSTEAPDFTTVQGNGRLRVVVFPHEGPVIEGARPRYGVGDLVDVNCTSYRSKPVVQLDWYINNEQAALEHLNYGAPVIESDDLITASLQLRFRIRPRHFQRSNVKLKCVSQLSVTSPDRAVTSPLYWRSSEVSAVRRRAPRLGQVAEAKPATAAQNSSTTMCRELARWIVLAVGLVLTR